MRRLHNYVLILFLLLANMPTCLYAQADKAENPIPNGSYTFIIMGDWGRGGNPEQMAVAKAMGEYAEKYNARFVIATGDNFYEKGVKSVNDKQWESSYEKVYTAKSLQAPWYITLGNHDYKSDPQPELDYTLKSNRWKLPARYYTIKVKVEGNDSAQLLFIDTSPFVKGYYKTEMAQYLKGQDTTAQLKWIDSVLSHSTAKWKFVSGHHPVYSSSPVHGNTPELIHSLKPLLEKYGVQAYFCGHDHDLQMLRQEGSKVDYILSGAASEIRPTVKNNMSLFSKSSLGFVIAAIKDGKLSYYYIDEKGSVLFQQSH